MTARWADRRVRQARLSAPDHALARRGAILLEDALATASLPGVAGERLVLVQRLTLGPIHVDRPPATLALDIERAVARLRPVLVHAEQAAASSAPAVWFADAVEARAALAVRLVRGPTPREWFWPLAVPDWRPGTERRAVLRRLLLAAARSPAEGHEAIALVATLAAHDVLDAALLSLELTDGPALLAALGITGLPGPPEATARLDEVDDEVRRSLTPWWSPLQRWVRRWGPGDARSLWLASVALIAQRPARVLDPTFPARVATLVRVIAGHSIARAMPLRPSTPSPPPPSAMAPSPPTSVTSTPDMATRAPDTGDMTAPVAPVPAALAEGQVSAHAGLVLLVPLLTRLGLASRLRAAPRQIELDLPRSLLGHLADRLRVPLDDPVRAALALSHDATTVPSELAGAVVAWTAGARGWARRRLGLPLAALACRNGRLSATRVHLDVTFDLRTADVRIRRAALDVDPGWVDWLGRVVQFHYE